MASKNDLETNNNRQQDDGGKKKRSDEEEEKEDLALATKELERLVKKIEADRAEMKKFLVIKSTQQQKREGVERPVDTAYVENEDGRLWLRAVFDVHHFQPDEIEVKVENRQLQVKAQGLDDRETALFRKTMIRKIDLPDNVDVDATKCEQTEEGGILTVSMPFHLPPSEHKPTGPATVPIITENGRRLIRLGIMIGPDFTMDDLKVEAEGQRLLIRASYDAEIGLEGAQVTRHELRKEFQLPEHIEVDEVSYELNKAGVLGVQILLKDNQQQLYRCNVTTEEVAVSAKH